MIVRLIVAAVVGAIVFFVLGFLIYGLALDPYFQANMVKYEGLIKDPPNFVALGLSNLVWGFLVAYIIDQWAKNRSFSGGFRIGAILLFLQTLALQLQFKAFMVLMTGYMVVVVDVLAATVMGAITGGVIGFVLGKMQGAES